MTTPVIEQVAVALLAKLAAISGITGLVVERERAEPVSHYPSLVLYESDVSVDDGNTGMSDYDAAFDIEGYVRATTGAAAATARNELYATALAAALADPSLGGIACDIREGPLVRRTEGDAGKPVAAFVATLQVRFMTRPGDPWSPGP